MTTEPRNWLRTLQALMMAGVIAAVIFTGWNWFLHRTVSDPYLTPHQPYVSVGQGFSSTKIGKLSHSMGQYLINFWRFGTE